MCYFMKMKEDVVKAFGDTIRFFRSELGISQEELANRSGFHRTYIGQVERGERNPSLRNIEIFSKTFGITLDELFLKCEELRISK